MISENYELLINKLKLKTTKKEAIWTKTSRDEEFKLDLDKGAITIDSYEGGGNRRFVDLSIFNDKGDMIDRIFFGVSDSYEYNTLMELHSLARRAYYKVDETFINILKALDSDKTLGKEILPPEELPF